MNLSIIIVTWNAQDYLQKSLNSIYENTTGITFEVIVVDNASSDGSVEMIKSKFPFVNLIENKRNLGFGSANNQGIRISKGKYILILNPDTCTLPGTLEKMVRFMDENKNVGILGCKILESDDSISTSVRRFPTLYTEIIRLLMSKRKSLTEFMPTSFDYNKTSKVDSLSGCCLLIRKEVLERSGLFDEDFFLYAEDIDLCYRIKQAGYQIYYFPDASIIHYEGRSAAKAKFKLSVEAYRTMHQFFKKHYSPIIYFLFSFFAIIISFIKIVILFFIYLISDNRRLIKEKISTYKGIIKISFIG